MFKYGVFSSPYFPVFRQNTEIYGVNLCIQSECRKIRTRKNSIFGYFSRSICSFVLVDSHQPLSLFHSWFELNFLPSKFHLHSHDACFLNVFDSFISAITLKTCKFKSFFACLEYKLLDMLLRVLRLLTHFPK